MTKPTLMPLKLPKNRRFSYVACFRVVRAVEEQEALKGIRSKITKESPN